MGRSPHAYALWMLRRDPLRANEIVDANVLKIRPVIDCRGSSTDLEPTLRSLRNAGLTEAPICIGGSRGSRSFDLQRPAELLGTETRPDEWLLPLRAADEIAPDALTAYAQAAASAGQTSLIYADDDLIEGPNQRHSPHFKPDWNPELFAHHDYISGACIVRAAPELLADLPDEQWMESLARAAITRGPPMHLRRMLHHRRARPAPAIPAKPSAIALASSPTITAIIPTRNRHELLRMCIEGLSQTAYPNISTMIVDNDSDEAETRAYLCELESSGARVLHVPGPFNYSALNNAAAAEVRSNLICFLNNDVEMTDPDWLALLVQHAVKPEIGAVGARLLYPDGTIQHAGVFTGIGGGAGHAHRFQRPDETGYFDRASLPQRVSAVTGACMVVEREKFLAVGGFDEVQFPVAFNDVDLCLKLNNRGWQSFYEPRATLIHHESKSRGSDSLRSNRSRFAGELAALKRVWKTDQFRDPYHHPDLSPFCEQFLVAV